LRSPGPEAVEERRRWRIFVAVCVAAVGLRLAVSQAGYNYDLQSWDLVSKLVVEGKSVYANTFRYPYGPTGVYLLGLLRLMAGRLGMNTIQGFHLLVAAVLSMADVGLGFLLWRFFGLAESCFYVLNPVSILITGYHSQIDCLAILLGFCGWLILESSLVGRSVGKYYGSALLMGLSLSIKHVLFLFPVWVVARCYKRVWGVRKHLGYLAISYGVFFSAFGLYLLRYPESLAGIREHVFEYRGMGDYEDSLLVDAISAASPAVAKRAGGGGLDLYTALFIGLLLLLGLWAGRRRPASSFYLYLAGLTTFAPVTGDEYLVIPLLACAVFPRSWTSWLFTAVATAVLLGSPNNIGSIPALRPVLYHFGRFTDKTGQVAMVLLLVALAFPSVTWSRRRAG
jgi:hypothetical protein